MPNLLYILIHSNTWISQYVIFLKLRLTMTILFCNNTSAWYLLNLTPSPGLIWYQRRTLIKLPKPSNHSLPFSPTNYPFGKPRHRIASAAPSISVDPPGTCYDANTYKRMAGNLLRDNNVLYRDQPKESPFLSWWWVQYVRCLTPAVRTLLCHV